MKYKIILASKSPRRIELLTLLHLKFDVIPSHIDEVFDETLSNEEIVMSIAYNKAKEVQKQYPDHMILGFDTIVVVDHHVLGKPENRDDGYRMLQMLSGRTHEVYSGCVILTPEKEVRLYDKADVVFASLSHEEIEEYLDTGEPYDRAGAYAIQGYAAKLIEGITGDYYAVMGVPLHKLYNALKDFE